MFEELKKIIEIFPEGYRDIRYENNSDESIFIQDGRVSRISKTGSRGAHFRILANGGMAVMSSTDLKKIVDSRDELINDARISASSKQRKIIFEPQAAIIDNTVIESQKNPLAVTMEEKLALLNEYCTFISSRIEAVTMSASYKQEYTKKHFANSEGSAISQEQLYSSMTFNVYIKTDLGDMQNLSVTLGGNDNYMSMVGMHDVLENYVSDLSELKGAAPIPGGRFNVILNPQLAGVFIHEAFGHLSEAEHIYYSDDLKKNLKIGKPIGPAHLSVIDDPSIKGVPGYYKYDDEGIPGKKTYIIKNGIINSYLNDRDSASYFGQALTGHCRAKNYEYPPIIRMSNIYIDKGANTASEIFDTMDDGYYLLNAKGGQTVGNHFTFGAQYGYRIKNGRKKEIVKDINISGELFSTLMNIRQIADDFEFDKRGGCGKDGQLISKSATGSAHVRIDNVGIGGKL